MSDNVYYVNYRDFHQSLQALGAVDPVTGGVILLLYYHGIISFEHVPHEPPQPLSPHCLPPQTG
jgi:hypothetical protein